MCRCFIEAELASIHNAEEEQFVESFIRESTDSRSAIYWLGGTWNDKSSWYWVDNSTETFSGTFHSCNFIRTRCKNRTNANVFDLNRFPVELCESSNTGPCLRLNSELNREGIV